MTKHPALYALALSSVSLALAVLSGELIAASPTDAPLTEQPPNIVVIIADDLGFGDVGCYGSKAIETPRIDQMASEGIRMNHCYAPASTCTPTRYSLLTGEYAWRQKKRRTTILDGDAPLAIAPGRPTLPALLAETGYETALVGKWHLGIGDGESPVDFNGHVGPGPLEVGFEHAYYIPATVDRVPCVFIENHAVHNLDPDDPIAISYQAKIGNEPTGTERPELLRYRADKQHSGTIINRISRIGWMSGGTSAHWVDEEITDTLVERANRFIKQKRDKPFFLLLGTHDPHVPHAPHDRFLGKSACGIRGDTIVQTDWLVGAVLDALREAGIDRQTLVLLTSDNGPTIFDGYYDGSVEELGNHHAAGQLRGSKYTVFEGGCRVPCIVRWPGQIEPGVSNAQFSLVDLLPSFAKLAKVHSLPDEVGQDGRERLEILTNPAAQSDGQPLVLQGVAKGYAVIHGDWKFIPANARGKKPATAYGIGKGANVKGQRFLETRITEDLLFNLADDPAESRNVIDAYPERADQMRKLLAKIQQQN